MKTALWTCVIIVGLGLSLVSPASAAMREIEPGVYFDDFEKGDIEGLEVDKREDYKPKVLEIVKDGDKRVLHLVGGFHSRVFYAGKKFEDFTLEVDVKKTKGSYAGVVVRDQCSVYFQMRGALCVNYGKLRFQSGRGFKGYHNLRVVCIGPVLRLYVDDERMFESEITPGAGRVGFYSHGRGEAFYDNIRINTRVDPLEALTVAPEARDDTLVFSPDEDVTLRFKVSNYGNAAQKVTVAAAVKDWDGTVVKETARREVHVAAKGNSVAEFDMGRIPGGFYRIDLKADCGGREIAKASDLPLAVQKRGTAEFKAPAIPLAPYSRYKCKKTPIYQNTYAHAIARNLLDHNFNAITAGPTMFGGNRKMVDIFQSYGVAVVSHAGEFMDHPAVIGSLIGDEPKTKDFPQYKKRYEGLTAKTDKPFTTCMVGEGMGLGDVEEKWRRLLPAQKAPGLRAFRWYGVKKHFYDVMYPVEYKGILPYADVMRITEAAGDAPLWVILPSFGGDQHEAYFQNPSAAQLKCLMNVSMAYGAKGLLFYTLQMERSTWPALVEQQSLKACDGKYAAAAEVAAAINANADLLKSLEHGGLDVRCRSPYIEVVPRRVRGTERLYVYVVNMNAKAPVSTELLVWADTWRLSKVASVFNGRELKIERDRKDGYLSIPLTLAPGEGQLLVTDAKGREKERGKKER